MQGHAISIVLVAGLVAIAGTGVNLLPADAGTGDEGQALAQAQTDISFTRQASDGRTVVVDRITLANGGFVAVHDTTVEPPDGDPVGSVIGASRYLAPGTHENVTVTLSEPVNETERTRVTAMPHRDTNGNRVFDFVTANGSVDGAYQQRGTPITDPATLDLSGEPLPARASLNFRNQSAGDTVTVRDVTLSAGGFVAIVDEDGDVVGVSRYLEAETQDTVRITLVERPDGRANLTARAHLDTDGDGTFGFEIADGRVDGAYRSGEVTDTASVRFQRGGTSPTPGFSPTPTPNSTPTGTPTFSPTPDRSPTPTPTP